MCESRNQLIWRHVRGLIHRTAVTWPTLAAEVRAQLERLQADPEGLVEWSDHRDTAERMKRDAQIVRRWAHDYPGSACHLDMPVLVEEALVFALGSLGYSGYQTLLTELSGRLGMLPVMLPKAGPAQDLHLAAGVMREAGEAIAAVATLTGDDGRIDEHDKAVDLRHAQIQIREAMAMLASADQRVTEALNAKGLGMPAPVRIVK